MVVIFDNVRVTLGKSRDLIGINFVWWKAYLQKGKNRKVLLKKNYKEWGFF